MTTLQNPFTHTKPKSAKLENGKLFVYPQDGTDPYVMRTTGISEDNFRAVVEGDKILLIACKDMEAKPEERRHYVRRSDFVKILSGVQTFLEIPYEENEAPDKYREDRILVIEIDDEKFPTGRTFRVRSLSNTTNQTGRVFSINSVFAHIYGKALRTIRRNGFIQFKEGTVGLILNRFDVKYLNGQTSHSGDVKVQIKHTDKKGGLEVLADRFELGNVRAISL